MITCPDDVLLHILCMLSPIDIIAVRQTTTKLGPITREKYLWVTMLRDIMQNYRLPLPSHIKAIESLASAHLEALVRRLMLSVPFWKHAGEINDAVCMGRVVRVDQPRSITWLHLVHDRWLLVAASDTVRSSLTCWDVSILMGGNRRPAAECFLAGPVQSAQVDIDPTRGLVVALGVALHPTPALLVLSLRRQAGNLRFARLAELGGLSYVRCLSGDRSICAPSATTSPFPAWSTGVRTISGR
ncbi:hypothetical protein PLICRDRAFT_281415 [Plicaturopsis crispa FD-325 SS-3]|nr:hypothetical protein PLICRDRAFT_281415 [Plicaturopsis crispa FD-325 SS-3]